MRWISTLVLLLGGSLLGGCSLFYGSDLPDECEFEDLDGDGFISLECGGNDCDDDEASVNPGAMEACNGEDDDCDDRFDENLARSDYYSDCDGDGVGGTFGEIIADCTTPSEAVACMPGFTGSWVDNVGDCDDHDADRTVACGSCAQVDMLIVMDTSASMLEEQVSLAMQLPRIVLALKTGDVDGDGVPESEPIADLHVGVVTPDLGVGPFTLPGCVEGGEDGVLRSYSGAEDSSCSGLDLGDEPFLSFDPGDSADDATRFEADWSCLVRAGIDGCAIEQPLEAALKAVTPASSSIRFFDESLGQGDGPNFGFVREDSLLVVVVITDEDDCSTVHPDLYDPESSTFFGDLNLRCHDYPEELHSISRYVGGLIALRNGEDLIYGVVSGVPVDLVPAVMEEPNYDAILADPRMQETVDPVGGGLVQSCGIPGRGRAFPPRRLLMLGQGLQERGSTTLVSSICQSDSYSEITGAVLQAAVDHGQRRCGPSIEPPSP